MLQWCLSFCRFILSAHMIMELNWSDHHLLGHHTNQSSSLSITQFGQEDSSGDIPGCFKLFPLRVTETTCFCEPSMKQNFFLNSSPDVWLDANLFLISTDCSFDLRAWYWRGMNTFARHCMHKYIFHKWISHCLSKLHFLWVIHSYKTLPSC